MNRRTSLVLMFAGISVLLLGFYLAFFWMKPLEKGDYDIEGGGVLQLSWYLEKGDRTEGGFTVSGGNEEVKFYIKDPSGGFVYSPRIVKTQFYNGFTAGVSGIYSFYFENPDLSDKVIHEGFRSPYEPRLIVFDIVGLLMMFGGTAILIYSVSKLIAIRKTNQSTQFRCFTIQQKGLPLLFFCYLSAMLE